MLASAGVAFATAIAALLASYDRFHVASLASQLDASKARRDDALDRLLAIGSRRAIHAIAAAVRTEVSSDSVRLARSGLSSSTLWRSLDTRLELAARAKPTTTGPLIVCRFAPYAALLEERCAALSVESRRAIEPIARVVEHLVATLPSRELRFEALFRLLEAPRDAAARVDWTRRLLESADSRDPLFLSTLLQRVSGPVDCLPLALERAFACEPDEAGPVFSRLGLHLILLSIRLRSDEPSLRPVPDAADRNLLETEILPLLEREARGTDPHHRASALGLIGDLGRSARSLAPALVEHLFFATAAERRATYRTLVRLEPDREIVPRLLVWLESPAERDDVLQVLHSMGPEATAAAPQLAQILESWMPPSHDSEAADPGSRWPLFRFFAGVLRGSAPAENSPR